MNKKMLRIDGQMKKKNTEKGFKIKGFFNKAFIHMKKIPYDVIKKGKKVTKEIV